VNRCLHILLFVALASARGNAVVGETERHVVLRAAGRADPWVGLGDGFELRAIDPELAAGRILAQGRGVPMSLATGDLDRDGVSDLVVGYRSGRGGLVAFHRGLVEAIFPVERSDASIHPFVEEAAVLELPFAPRWPGVGDFDADGDPDLLAGAPNEASLHLLLGDGRGGFPESRDVFLDGPVTALVIGPFGRKDGLPDVVVGVVGPSGPEVLVYGSPKGLFRGEPERFSAPEAASALVLAELTGDHLADLAIAAGSEVQVVHGRDVLPWVQDGPAPYATPLVIDRWTSPSAIVSLAAARSAVGRMDLAVLDEHGWLHVLCRDTGASGAGEWRELRQMRILPRAASHALDVLVPARISSREGDDLLIADRPGRRLRVFTLDTGESLATFDVEGLPEAVLPMRLNEDGQSDLVLLVEGHAVPVVAVTSPRATLTVDSTGESHDAALGDGVCGDVSGTCTLRAAIEEANAHPGADAIGFSVRSPTIAVTLGPLPAISDPVTIVGNAPGIPRIELDGSGAGASAAGLILAPGSSSSVVRSLVINRFSGVGLRVESADNRIENCYVGTDRSGLGTVAGNGGSGVLITGSAATGNVVGGASTAERNLISNNGAYGVEIAGGASGNTVAGNRIGTDPSGANSVVPNGLSGVWIRSGANGNAIGGATPLPGEAPGNVISGNSRSGVLVDANGSTVQGNLVGGDGALANALTGVVVAGSSNTIGGASVSLRNVVSGNLGSGIALGGSSLLLYELNLVQGNYIGTDVTGTSPLGNSGAGVRLSVGLSVPNRNHQIGGLADTPGAPPGNVISANGGDGISFFSFSVSDNVVAGNLIGTDNSGTVPLANGGNGIFIRGSGNTIGGSVPEARNVIAGFDFGGSESTGTSNGIEMEEAPANAITGNYIGTDITGTIGLGFSGNGVLIADAPNVAGPIEDNRIGGSSIAERNVIAANLGNGVRLSGANVTGNTVSGNLIGLDATGSGILGNIGNGVLVTGGAHGNRIGGETGSTPASCTGECNAIAYNSEAGVRVEVGSSVSNSIRANSIFRNGGLGIDLEPVGPTANDALDVDAGPNDLQNFPSIAVLAFDGASTTISGVLASAPNTTFVVDVFGNSEADPSGNGEGQTYLGTATVVTNSAGNGSFTLAAPGEHGLVSATATGPAGSTSEFGPVQVSPGEVLGVLVSKGPGTALTMAYTPACGATDHVAYVGSGGPGALNGPLAWTAAHCGLGVSGAASFDPGSPAAGTFLYFVIVGQDSEQEGSYGRNSAGAERPEAVGLGVCDQPRAVLPTCP